MIFNFIVLTTPSKLFLFLIALRHDPEVKQKKIDDVEKKKKKKKSKTSEKSVEYKNKKAVNLLRTLNSKREMYQIEEDQFQNQ